MNNLAKDLAPDVIERIKSQESAFDCPSELHSSVICLASFLTVFSMF
jgi:hypothetical protein